MALDYLDQLMEFFSPENYGKFSGSFGRNPDKPVDDPLSEEEVDALMVSITSIKRKAGRKKVIKLDMSEKEHIRHLFATRNITFLREKRKETILAEVIDLQLTLLKKALTAKNFGRWYFRLNEKAIDYLTTNSSVETLVFLKKRGNNPYFTFSFTHLEEKKQRSVTGAEDRLIPLEESKVVDRILKSLFRYMSLQTLSGYIFYTRTIYNWTQPALDTILFGGNADSLDQLKSLFISLADLILKDGVSAIETMRADLSDPNLKICLKMIIDGYDSHLVREIIENQLGQVNGNLHRYHKIITLGTDSLLRGYNAALTRARLEIL